MKKQGGINCGHDERLREPEGEPEWARLSQSEPECVRVSQSLWPKRYFLSQIAVYALRAEKMKTLHGMQTLQFIPSWSGVELTIFLDLNDVTMADRKFKDSLFVGTLRASWKLDEKLS